LFRVAAPVEHRIQRNFTINSAKAQGFFRFCPALPVYFRAKEAKDAKRGGKNEKNAKKSGKNLVKPQGVWYNWKRCPEAAQMLRGSPQQTILKSEDMKT
jgi:hypothetical protein